MLVNHALFDAYVSEQRSNDALEECVVNEIGIDVPDATSLMFCNGIGVIPTEADEYARVISDLFGGRKVIRFWNATVLSDFDNNLNGKQDLSLQKTVRLIDLLIRAIDRALQNDRRLVLFLHSHGALIANEALKHIARQLGNSSYEPIKNRIRIFSFGGAVMLPKYLALKVINVIRLTDATCLIGNKATGAAGDPRGAEAYRFAKRWRSLIRSQGAAETMRQIVREDGVDLCNPHAVQTKVNEYQSLALDYEFNVIEGESYESPPIDPADEARYRGAPLGFVGRWVENTVGNLIGQVHHHVMVEHRFLDAYIEKVRELAQGVLRDLIIERD